MVDMKFGAKNGSPSFGKEQVQSSGDKVACTGTPVLGPLSMSGSLGRTQKPFWWAWRLEARSASTLRE